MQVKFTIRLDHVERRTAIKAAQQLHNQSLNGWLNSQIRRLISDARSQRPDKFGLKIIELKPVDRTILIILTTEGRKTDADLAVETGLSMATIRRSLKRLVDNDLVYVREQGGKTEEASGYRKKIYISHSEE